MPLSTIKRNYKSAVICFGNSGLPLGQRDDIDDLAIMAHESNNPNLLKLFQELPSLEALKKARVEKQLQKFGIRK